MKKLLVIISVVIAVGAMLWFGRPVYHRLMAKRLFHAARATAEHHEDQEAGHLYGLALQRDPNNLEILRACADFLSARHSPQLVQTRERIRQLSPGDPEAFLDCVEAAIIFQQPKVARALLVRQAPPKAKDSARYYHLLCVSYFLANEFPQADAACAESLKRDPANKVYLVDQASLRVCAPNPAVRQAARASLDQFYQDHDEHGAALHALLMDAADAPLSELDVERVNTLLADAAKSIQPADSFFTDYLSALRRWHPEEFPARLDEFLKAAVGREESAILAQRWLAGSRLYAEVLAFRANLPVEAQKAPESLLFAAEAMFQLHQREPLESFLGEASWKHYPAFAQAWAERVRRVDHSGQGEDEARKTAWMKVLNSARGADELFTLSRMAREWQWPREYEGALWWLSEKEPRSCGEALEELSRYYLAAGDASGLLRVLRQQLTLAPGDPVVMNNFAYTSFLLDREPATAKRLVGDLCTKYPESTAFAATRAFGLVRTGNAAGALAAIKKFASKSLVGTPQGVTYGLVLAANKDPQASEYLKDAERLAHFPEERQFIAESRTMLPPLK